MRTFLFFALFLTTDLTAKGPAAAFDPFVLPQDRCQGVAGCGVRPVDKVIRDRGLSSVFEPAPRACCQGNTGVCGCASGQAVCCDGTTSPSCGC